MNPYASEELRDALGEAFPDLAALRDLVMFNLGVRLNYLVDEHQPHPAVVFDLLVQSESRGLTNFLLRAAVVARPGVPSLHAIVARVCPAALTLPAGGAADVEVVRRAVLAVRGRL